MTIRRLSSQLAGQIAAGEVVDRPASAVKELLENAVDAGAHSIRCEILSAGRQFIAVRDDGCGIPSDELPLALAPHATSKIAVIDDLNHILTLGFRGEALASIAAVSKLTLYSKTAGAEHAYSVHVEGPWQVPVVAPAAHPDGTSVEVRELFFNTPARRRFLKSERTEMQRIREVFVNCALAHPELDFELISEGRTVLKVKAAASDDPDGHRVRIARLAGRAFADMAVAVRGEDPSLQIEGLLLPPPSPEGNTSEQCWEFLNGRPLADRLLTHALREAYARAAGRRAPPRCVLYLSCDPTAVDVNVHPRKDEVRFHEPRLIHDLVSNAVLGALSRAGMCRGSNLGGPLAAVPPVHATGGPVGILARTAMANGDCIDLRPEGEGTLSPSPGTAGMAAMAAPAAPGVTGQPFSPGDAQGDAPAGLAECSAPAGGAAAAGPLPAGAGVFPAGAAAFVSEGRMHAPAGGPGPDSVPYSEPRRAAFSVQNVPLAVRPPQESAQSVAAEGGPQGQRPELLELFMPSLLLLRCAHTYFLAEGRRLERALNAADYAAAVRENRVGSYELLMPFAVRAAPELVSAVRAVPAAVSRCGFVLRFLKTSLELRAVPELLRGCDLASVVPKILREVVKNVDTLKSGECPESLALQAAASACARFYSPNSARELCARIPSADFLNKHPECARELDFRKLAGGWQEQHID